MEVPSLGQELKTEALKYLKLGWSVIPNGQEKKPLVNWSDFQLKLPTEKEIEEMFNNPDVQGIAVITGKTSNLIVLDIDDLNTFLNIQQQYDIPNTPISKTSKGYHIFFSYPDIPEIGYITQIYPKVELKAGKSCITLPPSLHPKGMRYEWLPNKSIFETKLAPIPEWLMEMISKNASGKASKIPSIITGVDMGSRDDSAVSVAGKIVYSFKPEEWSKVGWPLLTSWNLQNKPPLPEYQLKKCWESVIKREVKRRELKIEHTPLPSFLSHNDFYNADIPPIKWVVDKMIPYSGITALSAPPGHYKTWFALYLGIQIAQGNSIWGKFPTEKCGVLFVNEENYHGIIQDRIKMLTDQTDLSLYYLNNIGFKLNELSCQELLEMCQEKGIKFVIFDSLIRIHDKDENSATEIKKVFDYFKILTNHEITILFTHHHRKAGIFESRDKLEKMRGSSDIGAMIDTQLSLDLQKDNLILSQGKQRIGIILDPIYLKFITENGKADFQLLDSLAKEVSDYGNAKDKILEVITNTPGLKREEIIERLDKNYGAITINRILPQLVEERIVFTEGTRPKLYYPKSSNLSSLI